ncbi:MAG: M20/M25/M40 family metallo-hydrolase [Anaerolineae bacterium]
MVSTADLMVRRSVQNALDWLAAHADDTVYEAITICEIPAPTFHEAERGAWVAQQFQALGLADVDTDEVGNVYGRRPGARGGPGILLAAHLDTVFPAGTPIAVRRAYNRLYAPGLVDNSIAVAALLALARALDAAQVATDGDIWLVATVGEEGLGNLRGIRAACDRLGERVAAAVAVEGQGLGRVYTGAIGSRRYKITVRAPGGHSWGDFGARSAIHELFKLGAAIACLEVPTSPKVSYNIGVIGGGTSVNTIAEEAHCLLDMRSGDPLALADIEARIMALVEEARATPDVVVETQLIGDRPAGSLPEDHPLIQAAVGALKALGADDLGFPIIFTEGSTDANIPLSRNIPATCIAITTGGGTHTLGEFLDPEPVALGLKQLALLTLSVTGAA